MTNQTHRLISQLKEGDRIFLPAEPEHGVEEVDGIISIIELNPETNLYDIYIDIEEDGLHSEVEFVDQSPNKYIQLIEE